MAFLCLPRVVRCSRQRWGFPRGFPVRAISLCRHASSTVRGAATSLLRTDCGLHIDQALPPSFNKILIANRGEIACRVVRTAKQLNIKTVAVYSDADATAEHVKMADEAYRIGEAAAKDSYLLGDRILEVARQSGAQAIHPGYGFLSENAQFAEACQAAGVKFIGPPSSAIHAMGSKSASKDIMLESGVPCVPGYHGSNQDRQHLILEAYDVGFPLMIKAVLGGGGKGMRIVHKPEDFEENLDGCIREARNSFGDERVLLERYIQRPRHIEFQVFADQHGNAVHLYERDCSVQRRHQKVLEEAPAPGMSAELRDKMGKSAVDAARAVGYEGAGTVEFIFDADTDEYFFMEMNTRLQVEHPVSEMITRRDLVQWQLHVAAGHTLPATQEQIQGLVEEMGIGHALEARVYAEDPDNNFLPGTGRLVHLSPPPLQSDGSVRVETGVREGDSVTVYYDPMISKLVVWAPTRDAAISKMEQALSHYEVVGLPTNIPFLKRAVTHPEFAAGQVDTSFIAANWTDLQAPRMQHDAGCRVASIAALWLLLSEQHRQQDAQLQTNDPFSPWSNAELYNARFNTQSTQRIAFTSLVPDEAGSTEPLAFSVEVGHGVATTMRVTVGEDSDAKTQAEVAVDGEVEDYRINAGGAISGRVRARVGGRAVEATVVQEDRDITVFLEGAQTKLTLPTTSFGQKAADAGAVSPMAGKIVKVMVKPGEEVVKGQALLVMEAMKMEHIIRASSDSVVDAVLFADGDFAEGGKVLVTFQASE